MTWSVQNILSIKDPLWKILTPTLGLGYDRPAKKSRRELAKSIPKVSVKSKTFFDVVTWTAANNELFTTESYEASNAEYDDCSSSTISNNFFSCSQNWNIIFNCYENSGN